MMREQGGEVNSKTASMREPMCGPAIAIMGFCSAILVRRASILHHLPPP